MKYVNLKSFSNKYLNAAEIRAGRTRLGSRPVHITIEPTLKCNSNCVMCNRNAVRKEEVGRSGFLSWSTLKKLDPFLPWAERVLFGGFGESLLHPEYIPMLRHIKRRGPEVYFYTNGILLTPETSMKLLDAGVDQISISFGGGHPGTYRRVRGVEMAPIVDNLRALRKIRDSRTGDTPKVTFNIVAMNSVLDEMQEILELASNLGVSEVSMPNLTVQKPELEAESPWIDTARSRRILKKAGETAERLGIHLEPPDLTVSRGSCTALFKSMTITWDGLVLSCPMERFIIGNVNHGPVRKIWNGAGMIRLRRKQLAAGIETLCPNCFCWNNRPEAFLNPHYNSREFATDLRKNGTVP
jgi:MoaA/NifB/PqqE/SkfB family radical SAM enzyme